MTAPSATQVPFATVEAEAEAIRAKVAAWRLELQMMNNGQANADRALLVRKIVEGTQMAAAIGARLAAERRRI